MVMDMRKSQDKFAQARSQMVEYDLKGRDITDVGVLKAMAQIAREDFVPAEYQFQAYADGPLPIDCNQTISQPYIVALMTQLLQLEHDCEVLEVGTGSGYQTAILSRLARKVYTIERFQELSESAQTTLRKLNIVNVEFYIGDGSCGWPEGKIFDRIIITASVPQMPEPLINQLKVGGLMVGPIGYEGIQRLIVCEKKPVGVTERAVCDVRFVRLVGRYGFKP